jgi:hypothetical protein
LLQLSSVSALALLLAFVSFFAEVISDKYLEHCSDAWYGMPYHWISVAGFGKDVE